MGQGRRGGKPAKSRGPTENRRSGAHERSGRELGVGVVLATCVQREFVDWRHARSTKIHRQPQVATKERAV